MSTFSTTCTSLDYWVLSKALFYEEFKNGASFKSAKSRVVRQKDIDDFAKLTGDRNRLHVDQEYAKATIFGGTISHGLLTLGIALGQWYEMNLTRDSIVALIGINNISYKAPVRPGDSIHLESTVRSKRLSNSTKNTGLVTFSDRMLNQEGKAVLEFERTLMLKQSPGARAN